MVLAGHDNKAATQAARNTGIPLVQLQPALASHGLFTAAPSHSLSAAAFLSPPSAAATAMNGLTDTCLVLHTTGTTGTKKKVCYTMEQLLVGALCVAKSRRLEPDTLALSMLPLHHVAGVMRALALQLLGGSLVFSGAFDANFFWWTLQNYTVGYVAATPTMLQACVSDGKRMRFSKGLHAIATVESVGGPLPSTLAVDLAAWFSATILQGYALTECMPVTCPPASTSLIRPGSVGVPVGPTVAVLGDDGDVRSLNASGEILLRGKPLFRGYEGGSGSSGSSVDAEGWFHTGDLGHVDSEGFVFITGRAKVRPCVHQPNNPFVRPQSKPVGSWRLRCVVELVNTL